MTSVTVVDQYIVLLAITLVFTFLALTFDEFDWKHIMLQWFASLTWTVSAFSNMQVGEVNGILTITLTYLFAGFALIFSIVALYNSLLMMKTKGGI